MKPDYARRLAHAIRAMRHQKIDALLLTPGADMFYLSGFEHGHAFERLLAMVLHADGRCWWIAPQMNVAQIRPHLLEGQDILGWDDTAGYGPAMAKALSGVQHLGFDDDARAAFAMDLLDSRPNVRLTRGSMVMRELRQRKDPAEIAALRDAAATVDQTIPQAIALCRPGMSEADIDRELRKALLARSPDSTIAFTIIASGPNGAFPHHETARRVVEKGDVVIVDYGTRGPGGYHSDITVTCAAGEPADPDARRIYDIVYQAQQAAIAAVKPGAPCASIDRAARSVIENAGFGPNFMHRTGHGLGLQVHERPYMTGANEQLLEEGMVFSIEPGIYLPGRFGVRLEVIVSVGPHGCDPINQPSKKEMPISA